MSEMTRFQRIIFLTGINRHLKPVFPGHKRAGIVFAIYAPGIICFIKVENPLSFSGTIPLRIKVKIAPGAVCFHTGGCISKENKQPLLPRIALISLKCLLFAADAEPIIHPISGSLLHCPWYKSFSLRSFQHAHGVRAQTCTLGREDNNRALEILSGLLQVLATASVRQGTCPSSHALSQYALSIQRFP
jgi:hypothetical protein